MLIGVVIGAVIWIVDPADIGPGEGPSKALPILGIVGLLSGLGFSAILSVAERRRTLRDLSTWRVGLWGMLGSAAIPLLMGTDGSMGLLTGSLGFVFATASVTIARKSRDAYPLVEEEVRTLTTSMSLADSPDHHSRRHPPI
jgi:hypothetical protein